ncbi:hypothetical protein [Nocardioides stalactiti]|nr:hypothetical protein [Nocardioides stalactiti]
MEKVGQLDNVEYDSILPMISVGAVLGAGLQGRRAVAASSADPGPGH